MNAVMDAFGLVWALGALLLPGGLFLGFVWFVFWLAASDAKLEKGHHDRLERIEKMLLDRR